MLHLCEDLMSLLQSGGGGDWGDGGGGGGEGIERVRDGGREECLLCNLCIFSNCSLS